jgi:hypothetical protein
LIEGQLLSIEAELTGAAFNLLKKRLAHLPAATLNARDLTKVLVRYRVPSLGRSIIEIAMTVGPLVSLWALMWATLHIGYWLCLLLAVPTASFLVAALHHPARLWSWCLFSSSCHQ